MHNNTDSVERNAHQQIMSKKENEESLEKSPAATENTGEPMSIDYERIHQTEELLRNRDHDCNQVDKSLRSLEQHRKRQKTEDDAETSMSPHEEECSRLRGIKFLTSMNLNINFPLRSTGDIERCLARDQDRDAVKKTKMHLLQCMHSITEEKAYHDVGFAMLFGDNQVYRYCQLIYQVELMAMTFHPPGVTIISQLCVDTYRRFAIPLNWPATDYMDMIKKHPVRSLYLFGGVST